MQQNNRNTEEIEHRRRLVYLTRMPTSSLEADDVVGLNKTKSFKLYLKIFMSRASTRVVHLMASTFGDPLSKKDNGF